MDDYLGSVALPSMKVRQKKLCQSRLKARVEPVYNDTSNVGVRMLEKLGWSEGKGLGKREDGMAAPILPKMKQDVEGFGYVGERDDHWTQHGQDFNELLKSLNGEAPDVDEIDLAKMKSLEEKSKQSRARVHYKKFTRGKDLSRASEKDLANIFGKKSMNNIKESTAVQQVEVQDENKNERETNILGLTTIKASVSLQDYFKNKMNAKMTAETVEDTSEKKVKKLKKSRKFANDSVNVEDSQFQSQLIACEVDVDDSLKESKSVDTIISELSVKQEHSLTENKKSKKFKRSNQADPEQNQVNSVEDVQASEETPASGLIMASMSYQDSFKSKMQAKHKAQNNDSEVEVANMGVDKESIEAVETKTETKVKKSKKKKHHRNVDNKLIVEEVMLTGEQVIVSKSGTENGISNSEIVDNITERASKKSKRNKIDSHSPAPHQSETKSPINNIESKQGLDDSNTTKFVTSSMSYHDYFESKMQAKLKAQNSGFEAEIGEDKKMQPESNPAENSEEVRVKKSKKRKVPEQEPFAGEQCAEEAEKDGTIEVLDRVKKCKKSKKNKKRDPNEVDELGSSPCGEKPMQEADQSFLKNEQEPKKKKKSKRKHSTENIFNDDGNNSPLDDTLVENTGLNDPVTKKPRKNEHNSNEDLENEKTIDEVDPQSEEADVKKHKKKKRKCSDDCEPESAEQPSENSQETQLDQIETNDRQTNHLNQNLDEEISCRVRVDVLKQLDDKGFPGSNFADIVGYGLTHDVKLIKRESNKKRSLEKHNFIRQKQISYQRKRQVLKKVSAFKGI
ncbi:titin-like [Toxorhynchites rutilus septentrionalis]|uniref:titin-like n=1 Tax=Toxorhynchites rutilus septentrionalis TaxID=329112 RepID=UPI00247A1E2C|nr:titin-like [Toxorhynchites rutilus septentrionalis]